MTTTTLDPPVQTDAAVEAADPTILFPHGLVGCEQWKRFVLLTDEDEDLAVATLQSIDDPSVALMVTDPALLLPTYRVALADEERAVLGLADGEQPVLYCTLTIGADGWLTANLLGPLAINPTTRCGKQVVLTDSTYSTRHRVARVGADESPACSS